MTLSVRMIRFLTRETSYVLNLSAGRMLSWLAFTALIDVVI